MTARPEIQTISNNIRNYNDILSNQYFGQVSDFPDNWQNAIGKEKYIINPDTKIALHCKLITIVQLYGSELQNFEHAIFINMDNILTIQQLCGFDEKNFRQFQFTSGHSGKKIVGLYIFKNLNYSHINILS